MQIYIYFAETFRSFSKDIRETILLLLIPQIVKTTGECQLVWYIDKAIEEEMYALLHLAFVEGALISEDEIMRAMGAYALVELPLTYWKDVEQLERRAFLVNRTLNDSASSVRRESRKSSNPNKQQIQRLNTRWPHPTLHMHIPLREWNLDPVHP